MCDCGVGIRIRFRVSHLVVMVKVKGLRMHYVHVGSHKEQHVSCVWELTIGYLRHSTALWGRTCMIPQV